MTPPAGGSGVARRAAASGSRTPPQWSPPKASNGAEVRFSEWCDGLLCRGLVRTGGVEVVVLTGDALAFVSSWRRGETAAIIWYWAILLR